MVLENVMKWLKARLRRRRRASGKSLRSLPSPALLSPDELDKVPLVFARSHSYAGYHYFRNTHSRFFLYP